ncbi:glycoside hydrolase family 128 protein [Amanita thiersii Skay4041]|uniref:Glycoside hydrolase family 128 protein n=1 Tax=Amanita thiersii Skay4041 TaxID=703135 RepID=A0A2A9NN01_9AGAR|nr:glycoside hydrolase family 128 protein [Amanita thiersii Skay4041]
MRVSPALPGSVALFVSSVVAHTLPSTAARPATSVTNATTSVVSSATPSLTGTSTFTSIATPTPSIVPGVSAETVKKNKKRGLAFAAGDTPDDIINANQTKGLISWQYNWASIPPTYLATANIPYVPMQWGSGDIQTLADNIRAQDAKVVLAFNEPDFDVQSNIRPTDAALLWKQYIQPLKDLGVRLGAPAVTAAPTGRPWLTQFFKACDECTIDFLPIHWYGSGVGAFTDYVYDVHNAFPQYPIWITEYAEISPNVTVVLDFMNQTTTLLESLDWVERYSWFGYFRPKPDDFQSYNLLDDDGSLNALGQFYIGAKTIHTSIIPPGPSYVTVSGVDNPTQGLVTTYPAYASDAMSAWNILGIGSSASTATGVLGALVSFVLGMFWILF